VDSVLLWHSYPNIGIDNRNQFDMMRSLPGGLDGVHSLVEQFHNHGVRVLFPYNPWDTGTRVEGPENYITLTALLKEVNADGFNGDTMSYVPEEFWTQSLKNDHPLAIEPEGGPQDTTLNYTKMGWGYWPYKFIPCVDTFKWLESKHITHICNRWERNHTNSLQYTFFNGIGFVSWENVWGIWNAMSDRDAQALIRISRILRYFAPLLVSPHWEPHTPTLQQGVFASKWPGEGETLWTLVNRMTSSLTGGQLKVDVDSSWRIFDCYHGSELNVSKLSSYHQQDLVTVELSFPIEALGYGCVLAIESSKVTAELQSFLSLMNTQTTRPLSSFSTENIVLKQTMIINEASMNFSSVPNGMVKIPGNMFNFAVHGIEIEQGSHIGVDFQYPWEQEPQVSHSHIMNMSTFYIDKYPVTNSQFKEFIQKSGYKPKDDMNYLHDWTENGSFPADWDKKPVTWVDLDDARSYCNSLGQRLPNEWEWQYAAQGTDGRLYPWGNSWDAKRIPTPDEGHNLTGPANVDSHPSGASVFDVEDLVGNIYQWTNEFIDEHTRKAVLRGGSYYQPQGSHWYLPQPYRLDEHQKFLLMAPGMDRSATTGFRCAADIAE
jgi:formylglycine-generating enzyme required for sulfatase activity